MKTLFKSSLNLLIIILLPIIFFFIVRQCMSGSTNFPNFNSEQKSLIDEKEKSTFRLLNIKNKSDSLILKKSSTNISFFNDPYLKKLVESMKLTMQDTSFKGTSLSAPKIGINKNIIILKSNLNDSIFFKEYINPKILIYSDTFKRSPDFCISIPGINSNVYRALSIELEYNDLNGKDFRETIRNFEISAILQHEIDHLQGILWLDKINQSQNQNRIYINSN